MCIIAWVPPNNSYYTKEVAKECAVSNKDGIGFMFAWNHKVHIHKGFQTVDKYWEAFEPISRYYTTVSHFRFATHGDKKSHGNCHPFHVNPALGMAHNGIISIPMDKNETRSDTLVFVEEFIRKLPPNFLTDKYLTDIVSSYIGVGSKLCFLDGEGKTFWIHKKQGVDHQGCWFSNNGFKKTTYYGNWNNQTGTYHYPKKQLAKEDIIIPATSSAMEIGSTTNGKKHLKGVGFFQKNYQDLLKPSESVKEEKSERDFLSSDSRVEESIYYKTWCRNCDEDLKWKDEHDDFCHTCNSKLEVWECTWGEYQADLTDIDDPSLCHLCEYMLTCTSSNDTTKICKHFLERIEPQFETRDLNGLCSQCISMDTCQYIDFDVTECELFIPIETVYGYCKECCNYKKGWDGEPCQNCGSPLVNVGSLNQVLEDKSEVAR